MYRKGPQTLLLCLFYLMCESEVEAGHSILSTNTSQHCAVYDSGLSDPVVTNTPSTEDFVQAVFLNTSDGCVGSNSSLLAMQSAVVTALSENCTMLEVALWAQERGASMLVVVWNASTASTSDININDTIMMPVVLVNNVTGDSVIKELLSNSSASLAWYIPPPTPFDPSNVILIIVALTTVLLGSFLANAPYKFLKRGLLLPDDWREKKEKEEKAKKKPLTPAKKRLVVIFCIVYVLLLVMGTVASIMLLFFLYYPFVYVVLGLYSLAAVFSLYSLLSPFVALIPCVDRFKLPPNKIPILRHRPGPLFFLTYLFSIAIVVWWVVERHSIYGWIIHDVLGFAYVTMIYKAFVRVKAITPAMVAVFMCLLFLYDIFIVFITRAFTGGASVLERAITGPPGSTETLPIVYTAIRLIYPTPLDEVCNLSRGRSILGYGDTFIPGLMIGMALRHDLLFRAGKCFKIYFFTSACGYMLGLAITYIVLHFSRIAQPALLYLVPTTVGSVLIVSLVMKECRLFFTGKNKGQLSNDKTEAEEQAGSAEGDSEKNGDENANHSQDEPVPLDEMDIVPLVSNEPDKEQV